MCEFCENGKPIISIMKQFRDRIESVVCGIKWNCMTGSTLIQTAYGANPPAVVEVEIQFCPMCGRELRSEENE